MHDEFERAMTGQPKKSGLSFLAWAGIAFGVILVVGAVGVVFAVRSAVHHTMAQVEEIVQEIGMGEFEPTQAAAQMVSRLQAHAQLVSVEPTEGLAFLESLDAGEPSEALVQNLVEGAFKFRTEEGEVAGRIEGDEDGGFLTIQSDEGSVRMDLTRNEDGGSLVVDSDDGQVRFDLVRTEGGGFLTIDSDDGQVRFDLRRTDDGGYLSIDSDEGSVRFDLSGGEDGGQLVIRTDDETLRFGLGDEADRTPNWVPLMHGMVNPPRPVYSLDAGDDFLGAVTWLSTETPDDVLAFYQAELADAGYEQEAAHRLRADDEDGGSIWARNADADRMVFVVVRQEDGVTRVLLGYGDGQD